SPRLHRPALWPLKPVGQDAIENRYCLLVRTAFKTTLHASYAWVRQFALLFVESPYFGEIIRSVPRSLTKSSTESAGIGAVVTRHLFGRHLAEPDEPCDS